jgi:hypothetical protein
MPGRVQLLYHSALRVHQDSYATEEVYRTQMEFAQKDTIARTLLDQTFRLDAQLGISARREASPPLSAHLDSTSHTCIKLLAWIVLPVTSAVRPTPLSPSCVLQGSTVSH